MDRSEMAYDDFASLLTTRLRHVRAANPDQQRILTERAWDLVQRKIPWSVVLAATRASANELGIEDLSDPGLSAPALSDPSVIEADGESVAPGGALAGREDAEAAPLRLPPAFEGPPDAFSRIDPRDLAQLPPPPLRREAGRFEREQLSANTRQAIRMGRQARRWHEIRKMRNVLMNIDQGYLKRMLGAESDALNQEINALLRSWAPLVREQQHGGRPTRRRR